MWGAALSVRGRRPACPPPSPLEQDWDAKQKEERERILAGWKPDDEEGEGGEGSEEEDDLPFACFICRRPWAEVQEPVVTRCKHYFCEQCALQHNAKSSKCFVCEQTTGGIFNVAQEVGGRPPRLAARLRPRAGRAAQRLCKGPSRLSARWRAPPPPADPEEGEGAAEKGGRGSRGGGLSAPAAARRRRVPP